MGLPHLDGNSKLEHALALVVTGGVDFSTTRRAEYSADASNYRRIPLGVVFPANTDEVVATVDVCRSFDVPITLRGGGTSVAGNAIGDGVIVDCSRYLNRIISIDPQRRLAHVEPGVVLDDLQAAAAPHGLRFGPDPSSHSRCTIGGMIGNNSCGAHSLGFGRTADNVVELDVVMYDGTRLTVGPTSPEELHRIIADGGRLGELYKALRDLSVRNQPLIRERLGRFTRQISGYSLEHLLPENGFDLARALVGTEGTCAIVLGATLRLVAAPVVSALVVLGFADLPATGDAVTVLIPYQPTAIEGIDAQVVNVLRSSGIERPDARSSGIERLDVLPDGQAWLLVEFASGRSIPELDVSGRSIPELGGSNEHEVAEQAIMLADELASVTGACAARVATSATDQRTLWRIREDAVGLSTRMPDGSEAWPGWEDAAVPPERLGSYLRGFQELMKKHQRRGAVYGHFGEGCVHTRIDFNFTRQDGVRQFRTFLEEACSLAGEHGGSFSGEHGDGMARSEFLPKMYGEELVSVFGEFKTAWDPAARLNPGIIVNPVPVDDHLRVDPARRVIAVETAFSYPEDGGDFAKAIRRCVGVGKCRSDSGAVMCPSFRATHDERDSTRGRARVLNEMLQGDVVTDGWRSTEALDALDLCLACKGCKTDCPVNVDMATYKAEFLYHHYAGRLRPASHYSLGWFPVWARVASLTPKLVNRLSGSSFASPAKTIAGIAPERPLPTFAHQTFRNWFASQGFLPRPNTRRVLLWVDTFTNYMAPHIGQAAVKVIQAAGYEVLLPPAKAMCCGLTWVSTGQLGMARKVMQRTLDAIDPILATGIAMVGLEPSCTAVFRSDLVELLGSDQRANTVAAATVTLAEFLDVHAPDWQLPQLAATSLTQTHCHQHAIMGFDADERVLGRLGLGNTTLDKGCCGLAGNFGYERGHYDVSVAIAEQGLLPDVRAASPDSLIISDGFSCRTQLAQLAGRSSLHLAEVIAMNLP